MLDDDFSNEEVHIDVGVIREAALPRGVRFMGVGGRRPPSPVLFKERHRLSTREPPRSIRGRHRSDLDDDDDETQDIFI